MICWQATPAFHNTTVASHDATAASHDTTAASYDTTVTSHDTNVASPNTTAICAGAQDAFRGPTTSTLAKSPNVLGSTLASTSNSPVQRTRFDIVLPRLPQQLKRRVADCAKVELVSTHFKPGRPDHMNAAAWMAEMIARFSAVRQGLRSTRKLHRQYAHTSIFENRHAPRTRKTTPIATRTDTSTSTPNADRPMSVPRTPSTPYVSGSSRVRNASTLGSPFSG